MGNYVTSADFVEPITERAQPNREAHSSGVSWGAVIGGAFVASALYLILLALGAGFGLSAVSPWSNVGITASTAGAVAIAWLVVIQIIASAFGGYLTGRLRTKWTLIHSDEVYFRDTANGFLAWAVALVVSVAFLASAAASMAGAAAQARTTTSEGTSNSVLVEPNAYFVDALFRSDRPGEPTATADVKAEASRILVTDLKQSEMAATDQGYLARLVSARTGLSQAEAEKRVSDVVNEARQAEDKVRKETSHLLLWLFLSFLMGAFSASYAATIGGRQRDHVKAV
ncbi:MAG TPA: hypothetical protein VKU01_24550 [Bryobacteraceae bacterium]|nr:hypothetical protein [Bryobacteraceae bacterium]